MGGRAAGNRPRLLRPPRHPRPPESRPERRLPGLSAASAAPQPLPRRTPAPGAPRPRRAPEPRPLDAATTMGRGPPAAPPAPRSPPARPRGPTAAARGGPSPRDRGQRSARPERRCQSAATERQKPARAAPPPSFSAAPAAAAPTPRRPRPPGAPGPPGVVPRAQLGRAMAIGRRSSGGMAADCEAAARLLARSLPPSLPPSRLARRSLARWSLGACVSPLASLQLSAPRPPACRRPRLRPPPPASSSRRHRRRRLSPQPRLSPRSAPCRASGDPRSPAASGPEKEGLGSRERGSSSREGPRGGPAGPRRRSRE